MDKQPTTPADNTKTKPVVIPPNEVAQNPNPKANETFVWERMTLSLNKINRLTVLAMK